MLPTINGKSFLEVTEDDLKVLVENADYRESDYIEVIDCIMSRDNDYIMF